MDAGWDILPCTLHSDANDEAVIHGQNPVLKTQSVLCGCSWNFPIAYIVFIYIDSLKGSRNRKITPHKSTKNTCLPHKNSLLMQKYTKFKNCQNFCPKSRAIFGLLLLHIGVHWDDCDPGILHECENLQVSV